MADDATTPSPTKGDAYLVLGLAVASVVFAILYSAGSLWLLKTPLWLCCLASILTTAPLLYRRRFPSQVAWTQCVIYSAASVIGAMELAASQIVLFMGIYSIGAWQRNRRTAFWSRLLLCLGMAALFSFSMIIQFNKPGEVTVIQFTANGGVSFLVNVAFFGGAWVFGNRAWRQRMTLEQLRAADSEVRAQEQKLTRQALDLERVRIARELHDGVAHHIAGVGIHAAAARRSLEKNPDKARESLKTIETSTRETVEELRTLVYTLRDSDDASTVGFRTEGNPGLGDLQELFAAARRSGQHIEVSTVGEPRALTPIAEMSVYRVIQESLTNCQRYAGTDAEVDVRLRYGTAELEVEVSDFHDAGPDSRTAGGTSVGTGLGIVGMRERMSAVGGRLEAGPKSRGGWLVRATIPYARTERFVPESETAATSAVESSAKG